MSKHKRNNEVAGYRCTYEIVETGQEISTVQNKNHLIYAKISDAVGWEKSLSEAKVGELFEGLLNFITAPLEELETILDESPTYYEAKSAVCIINSAGKAIPQVRYFLIKGLLERDELRSKIDNSNLEKKLLKEDGFDFSKEEYNVMTDFLHSFLQGKCEAADISCVEKTSVRYRYLKGDGLFPEEWDYFKFFCEINQEFEAFTKGFTRENDEKNGKTKIVTHIYPESKAFFYDVYVQKRRKLRRRLEQIQEKIIKAKKEHTEPDIYRILKRHYGRVDDITPELQLLFQHYDGKESQYITLRLKSKKALSMERFEVARIAELNATKKNVRIVENNAPKYPAYKQFQEFPLCCVNTLLSSIFRYSLLKYFSDEFDKRGLPHLWVAELEAVVLFDDGIVNKYTQYIKEKIERGRGYIDGVVKAIDGDTGRLEKEFELFAVAEKARKAIAFGEFDPAFNLAHGKFIAFYNVLKRTINTLPDKYWEVMQLDYMFSRGATVSYSLPFKRKGKELTDEEILAIKKQVRDTREHRLDYYEMRLRELMAQMPKIMHKIYGSENHKSYILPWEFLLNPFILNIDVIESEKADILKMIENPGYSAYIIGDHELWKKKNIERFSKEKTEKILTELKIPEIRALVHHSNFLEVSSGYSRKNIVMPARWIYSSSLNDILNDHPTAYATK